MENLNLIGLETDFGSIWFYLQFDGYPEIEIVVKTASKVMEGVNLAREKV